MDLAEKIFERAARYTRVLQSQLTILPGLHKDSEMDGTVVLTPTPHVRTAANTTSIMSAQPFYTYHNTLSNVLY